MLFELFWFILVGIFVALIARLLLMPAYKIYEPWGIFVIAILGAILGGLFMPLEGLFAASFVFFSTLLAAFIVSIITVWLIGLIVALIWPNL